MSSRAHNIQSIVLAVGTLLDAFASGCSPGPSGSKWASSVPGTYAAAKPGFQEVIDLRPDGTFRHQVDVAGRPVCSEEGHWSFSDRTGTVLVEPFTSFFDKQRRVTTDSGRKQDQDAIFVMRYGAAAEKVSPSVDFEWVLEKRKGDSAPRTR